MKQKLDKKYLTFPILIIPIQILILGNICPEKQETFKTKICAQIISIFPRKYITDIRNMQDCVLFGQNFKHVLNIRGYKGSMGGGIFLGALYFIRGTLYTTLFHCVHSTGAKTCRGAFSKSPVPKNQRRANDSAKGRGQ